MSIFVIARFKVSDLGKALEWGKANGDIAEDITAYGKSLGQIGHRMLTDGRDMEAYAKVSLKKYKPMAARNEDRNVSSGLL